MDLSNVLIDYDPLKAGSIDGTDTNPHDRAIVRAMNANYKPNLLVDGDPTKTIFVSNINRKTNEDALWTAFRQFGKIEKCRLVCDIVTGFSKGYGFIEYEDKKDAVSAHRRGNKLEVDTASLFVDFECERVMKGWIPRRFGGGFGGNKKSGQLRFGGRDRPFLKPIYVPGQNRLDILKREKGNASGNNEKEKSRQQFGYNRDNKYRNNHQHSDRYSSSNRERSRNEDRSNRRDRSRSVDRHRYSDRRQNESKDRRDRSRSRERKYGGERKKY